MIALRNPAVALALAISIASFLVLGAWHFYAMGWAAREAVYIANTGATNRAVEANDDAAAREAADRQRANDALLTQARREIEAAPFAIPEIVVADEPGKPGCPAPKPFVLTKEQRKRLCGTPDAARATLNQIR